MAKPIKKFYIFNFSGRILGIIIDLVLIYFASDLYAKSYYLLSSIPVVIYSLSGYISSISKVSSWALGIMLKSNIIIFFVSFYCLASYYIVSKTNFDDYYDFVVLLIITSFFAGIITNSKAAKNENTVWLFPAAGFVSLCIALIGALTLTGGRYEPFFVVFLMTIIRPIVFALKGKTSREIHDISNIKLLSIIALAFCGIRHLILILYRFYVPDHFVIEYSFNSRIIQNIYAFSLIPLIINLEILKININTIFKNLTLAMLSAIFISLLLLYNIENFEYLKVHFGWLLIMLIMGIAIFCSDYYLVTLGEKFPLRVLACQITVSIFIFIINYCYWGFLL